VNTEIAKRDDETAVRGWIFYDAVCGVCTAGRRRTGRLFESRGFRWVPLQTPGTAERLGVSENELWTEMRLQIADGRVLGGIHAWGYLLRRVWWLWPVGALLRIPLLRELADTTYRWVARNRYRFSGRCRIER
jgi:predicted DCC family thiol-disulfide oxidoreductase YuxK